MTFWERVHSYFEKGCQKKGTRQSRKVLWVVLSLLFFKEIWKNSTRSHGHMFASAKEKQQKKVRQLLSSGTVYWSYPILPFGIVACTFFFDNFSRNSCIKGRYYQEIVRIKNGVWTCLCKAEHSVWILKWLKLLSSLPENKRTCWLYD